MHLDVLRDVEKRLGVVEDDPQASVDELVRSLLRVLGGDGEHSDDDVLVPDDLAQVAGTPRNTALMKSR